MLWYPHLWGKRITESPSTGEAYEQWWRRLIIQAVIVFEAIKMADAVGLDE